MSEGVQIPEKARHSWVASGLQERWRTIATWTAIAFLHFIGWGALVMFTGTSPAGAGNPVLGLGIGFTAYLLGIRHAFDADHIAAIDNTTRKLMQERKQPVAVGFWFSFGHSTVVFLLTLAIALGISALADPVLNEGSDLHRSISLVGTLVSIAFLYAIAAVNLGVLARACSGFRDLRIGRHDVAGFEAKLSSAGILNRLVRSRAKVITAPWQMYLVGFLFGLGFDTATEIALLAMTASGVASGLPWYAVLCLPVLFAAGMSLFDTLDGAFMIAVYGWALEKPMGRIYYNLTVTALSVTAALIIGTIEIASVFPEQSQGPFWHRVAAVDLNTLGFVVVGIFVATLFGAVALSQKSRPPARTSRDDSA